MKSFRLTILNTKRETCGRLRGDVMPEAGLAFVAAFDNFLRANPEAVFHNLTPYAEAATGETYELRLEMVAAQEALGPLGPSFLDKMQPLTADGRVKIELIS